MTHQPNETEENARVLREVNIVELISAIGESIREDIRLMRSNPGEPDSLGMPPAPTVYLFPATEIETELELRYKIPEIKFSPGGRLDPVVEQLIVESLREKHQLDYKIGRMHREMREMAEGIVAGKAMVESLQQSLIRESQYRARELATYREFKIFKWTIRWKVTG